MRVEVDTERLPRIERGSAFAIAVDGRIMTAYSGETIAAVLLANGIRQFDHPDNDTPRGVFCGIGRCFSCLVTVDGQPDVRACVTPARPGMRIETRSRADG